MAEPDRYESVQQTEKSRDTKGRVFAQLMSNFCIFTKTLFSVYTLEEVLQRKVEIPVQFHPLQFFPEYLKQGYYPFSSENQNIHIQQIVNLALESDIPQYAGMNVSTGRKLKQLLAIIAKSVPFKPNVSSIAAALNVSRNSVAD